MRISLCTALISMSLPLASTVEAADSALALGMDPVVHALNAPSSAAVISVPNPAGPPVRALSPEQAMALGLEVAVPVPPAPPPAPEPSTPHAILNSGFDAMPYSGFIPPDPVMAVGPNEPKLLLSVNGGLGLFDSAAGTAMIGPISWDGGGSYSGSFFGGPITASQFAFDPRCIYDPHDNRFWGVVVEGSFVDSTSWLRIFMSRADSDGNPASNPDDLTLATPLSLPGVGAHSWTGWNIDADADLTFEWADYPDIGVDDTNIYISANFFGGPSNTGGQGFKRSRLWVIPKSALIAEQPVISTVTVHGNPGAPLVDGTFNNPAYTIRTPIDYDASGTYHVVARGGAGVANTAVALDVWNVNPATRALTNPGPNPQEGRQVLAPPFGSFTVIDAPTNPGAGGADPIEAGNNRALTAVERGGALWVNGSNFHPNPSPTYVTSAWYKLDASGTGTPTVLDSGEVGGPSAGSPDLFWAALAVDAFGDPFLVMARTSSTENVGIAVTGRDDDVDPAGTMQPLTIVQPGLVAYENLDSGGRNRWGDYGGAAWDPTTGEVWGFHEYAFSDPAAPEGSGNERWQGRVFSLSIEVPVELSVFDSD